MSLMTPIQFRVALVYASWFGHMWTWYLDEGPLAYDGTSMPEVGSPLLDPEQIRANTAPHDTDETHPGTLCPTLVNGVVRHFTNSYRYYYTIEKDGSLYFEIERPQGVVITGYMTLQGDCVIDYVMREYIEYRHLEAMTDMVWLYKQYCCTLHKKEN